MEFLNKLRELGKRIRWALLLAGLLATGLLLAAHYARPHVRFINLDFERLLFANLIGVLLGALIAVETDRWLAERHQKRQMEEARDQRRAEARQALGGLKKAIRHNQEELDAACTSLEDHPDKPVFSSSDPRAFDPILTRVVETGVDLDLIRKTSTFRHQLEEFNRMAEAQLELFLLPDLHPVKGSVEDRQTRKIARLRQQMVEKTVQYGRRLSKQADGLLEEVERVREGFDDAA